MFNTKTFQLAQSDAELGFSPHSKRNASGSSDLLPDNTSGGIQNEPYFPISPTGEGFKALNEVTVSLDTDLAGKQYQGSTFKANIGYESGGAGADTGLNMSMGINLPLSKIKAHSTTQDGLSTLPVLNDTQEKKPLAVSPDGNTFTLSELADNNPFENQSKAMADYKPVEHPMNGKLLSGRENQPVVVHLMDGNEDDKPDAAWLAPVVSDEQPLKFKSMDKSATIPVPTSH
jgi:hypothetical protein